MKYFAGIGGMMLFALFCMADVPVNEISKEKVLARSEYRAVYDGYAPDAEQVNRLKAAIGEGLKVDVYLGLWCPDSVNNVPKFLKTLEAAATPVEVRLFRVERKPVKTMKYFVSAFEIERVPTFIFYRGGKEIGRIVENPKTDLAADMTEILSNR